MTCCNPSLRPLPNAFDELANSSGNLTITPTRANQFIDLAISGAARTSYIILSRVRRRAGDMLNLIIDLPATAAIVLDFRNGAVDGTALLPEEKFPSQQFTTDGEIRSLAIRFVYTGSAWKYVSSQSPA
jgi:hypothetical protein